jgi:hypothetical protein
MPATIQSMLAAASHEWEYWGQSTWDVSNNHTKIGHTDDESKFAQYVIDKYCSIGGGSPPLIDIQDDRYYWSAVGMSAIMSAAGFKKTEFPFAQSHSVWIRYFIKAANNKDTTAAFWGYGVETPGVTPDVGDLVAYAREKHITAEKAAKLLTRTRNYDSHSDVVVARRTGELDVIGCNVLDSVTMKTLKIDTEGHIVDNQHAWFAVLKRRGN